MALININELSIHFRGPALLDGVSCQIEPGERIALLGRNGAGKTTFLRILSGELEPDAGQIAAAPGTKISLLAQTVPQHITGRLIDVVATGLKPDEHEPAWQAERRVERILSDMELPGEARFEVLSSGMKRRVLLAQALASAPDLLLLDEPTNHLDVEAITWLEDFLPRFSGTLLFVTHDRMFLRKLAGRILEIDGGRLFDWSCDYDTFLSRKETAQAAEEKQNALFDKNWRRKRRGCGKASRLAGPAMKGASARSSGCGSFEASGGRRTRKCRWRSRRDSAAALWWPIWTECPSPMPSARSSVISLLASCVETRSASSVPMAQARPRCCGCFWGSYSPSRARSGRAPTCKSLTSTSSASN